MGKIAKGIWPTMITPFTAENRIDEQALEEMMEWYVKQGCDGVFAVCQSSEMFSLTLQERVHLARRCVELANGRLQVVASGHISDRLEDQLEEIRAIWETGVRAVVLVTNRLAREEESDAVWMQNAQHLLDALPDVTFGMYECPYPYKRLITKKTMIWMVESGRFAFLKDTCCQAAMIRERLRVIQELTPRGAEPMGLYNANTMTLLESLQDGADGFCGVMGNLHPDLYQWLFRNFRKETARAKDLQAALTLLSGLEAHAYPICAKKHMQDAGIHISLVTRVASEDAFCEADQEILRQAERFEALLRRLYLQGRAYAPRWHSAPSQTFAWRRDEKYPVSHPLPGGITRQIVHRADETYPFLHDTGIALLQGKLLCAWYNCSENEIVGETVIRGCWSEDGGKTWGEPEMVAKAPAESGLHMVPAIFTEEAGNVYAYITQMCAHDRPVGYVCYRHTDHGWLEDTRYAEPFLFNAQPICLPDGHMLSAGRMSAQSGELPWIPCVFVRKACAPAGWEARPLPGPWQYGVYPLLFPETTLLADGMHVTAVTRNDGGKAQVFESADAGITWSQPQDVGLPVGASKMCGGTLRNGIQYLIYNEKTDPPSRNRLVIALRPGRCAAFEKVYTLFEDEDAQLRAGPMWHYPCAVEFAGKLYVSCTSSRVNDVRRDAAIAAIPIDSLVL